MRRSPRWILLLTLCTLLAVVAPVAPASARSAAAIPQPARQLQIGTAKSAEVVVLTSSGQIRVDNPFPPAGHAPFTWNSGSDIGWQNIAVGHFDSNGSEHQEIVAIKGGMMRIFQLIPTQTILATLYTPELGNFRQLTVGDFDADGRDEVAVSYAPSFSPSIEYVVVYDGGPDGHSWNPTPTRVKNTYFYPLWQDMKSGDINNDGADDLVMARRSGHLIKAFLGRSGGGFTEVADYTSATFPYVALAVGRVHSSAGDEIVASRDETVGRIRAVLNLRYSDGAIHDITDLDTRFYPEPTSVALGDLNGDGDQEALLLRDPQANNRPALLIRDFDRPSGGSTVPSTDLLSGYYGAYAFRTVRAGDVDADGRDEIVVLNGDRYQIYGDPAEGYQLRIDSANYSPRFSYYINPYVASASSLAVANLNGDGTLSAPTFTVSPAALDLGSVPFGQLSDPHALDITNQGNSQAIAWQAQVLVTGPSWLHVSRTSGVTPAKLYVWADTIGLGLGQASGYVRITTTDPAVPAAQRTHLIPVDVSVTDSGLVARPESVTIFQQVGDAAPVVNIDLYIPEGTVSWTATPQGGSGWLLVSPLTGHAGPGTTDHTIHVTVNPSGLGVGVRTASIVVSGSGFSDVSIPIKYALSNRVTRLRLPLVVR